MAELELVKNGGPDSLGPDPFGPDFEEPEYKKVNRTLRIVIALAVIAGLIYISGLYQSLFYQRTSKNVQQDSVASKLDVEEITLPLSVFILRSSDQTGSQRTQDNTIGLVKNSSNIWEQSNIRLVIKKLKVMNLTDNDIALFYTNPREFISTFEYYDYNTINVFLVGTLNGINGIAFTNMRSVAVADYTSVYDFRALAHEVGHILGLNHVNDSRGRLMYQGANGSELSLQEITTAREKAINY